MKSIPHLHGTQLHTYDTIFRHPVSHNLEWRAVYSLLKHLGEVEEERNGNLKVTRNGQTIILHRMHTKDVAEVDEVLSLRRFLEKSESVSPDTNHKDARWFLVIDHHQARIFRSEIDGSSPQRILPEEYFRHTRDSGNVSRGKEKPDPTSFFVPVAKALQAAGQILIFGNGTGTSSEMDQFVGWLKQHHPEVSQRIIRSLAVDEHHLTDQQLFAKAQEFYSNTFVA